MKKLILLTSFLVVIFSANLFAKSYGAALAWGLSPLPGAGLFYTEHPVAGFFTAVVGVPALALGLSVVIQSIDGTDRCNARGGDDCGNAVPLVGIPALAVYGVTYLIDAITTSILARKYIKKQARITPFITGDKNMIAGGVSVRF